MTSHRLELPDTKALVFSSRKISDADQSYIPASRRRCTKMGLLQEEQ